MNDYDNSEREGKIIDFVAAPNAVIHRGNMVASNAAGQVVTAADDETLVRVEGASESKVNNTGITVAEELDVVRVRRRRVFAYENSATDPVGSADVFSNVGVEDGVTIKKDATKLVAGRLLGFDSLDGRPLVEIG